jgi:hypothetical protein
MRGSRASCAWIRRLHTRHNMSGSGPSRQQGHTVHGGSGGRSQRLSPRPGSFPFSRRVLSASARQMRLTLVAFRRWPIPSKRFLPPSPSAYATATPPLPANGSRTRRQGIRRKALILNASRRRQRAHNGLVAGSSPSRPTNPTSNITVFSSSMNTADRVRGLRSLS